MSSYIIFDASPFVEQANFANQMAVLVRRMYPDNRVRVALRRIEEANPGGK